MPKIKNLLINFIILFFSILVVLILFEIGFRLFYPQNIIDIKQFDQYDKLLGWKLLNNSNIEIKGRGFEMDIITDDFGFRNNKTKFNNQKNIILIGDSYLMGWGVPQNKTFAYLFNENIRGYDFINLGCGGYGTDQELLSLYEYGLKYNPEIVILFLFSNDLSNNLGEWSFYERPLFFLNNTNIENFYERDVGSEEFIIKKLPWIKNDNLLLAYPKIKKDTKKTTESGLFYEFRKILSQNSHLYNFLVINIKKLFLSENIITDDIIFSKNTSSKLNYSINLTYSLLDEMVYLSKENNFTLIITAIPEKYVVESKTRDLFLKQYDLSRENTNLLRVDNLLKNYSESRGIKYISLYSSFEEYYDPNLLYLEYDLHLSPEGHLFVYHLIREKLIREKLF